MQKNKFRRKKLRQAKKREKVKLGAMDHELTGYENFKVDEYALKEVEYKPFNQWPEWLQFWSRLQNKENPEVCYFTDFKQCIMKTNPELRPTNAQGTGLQKVFMYNNTQVINGFKGLQTYACPEDQRNTDFVLTRDQFYTWWVKSGAHIPDISGGVHYTGDVKLTAANRSSSGMSRNK